MLVDAILSVISPRPSMVLDLGANTGIFSRIAADRGISTVALDIDANAVEKNYIACGEPGGSENLLPLIQDITNPSPDLGWALGERKSLLRRCEESQKQGTTTAFALALVHHLAIGNNVPLPRIAALFADIAPNLILEWVPKEDSQVRRLLATRPDIFPDYTRGGLEQAFSRCFHIESSFPVPGTDRVLYHLRRLL